MRFRLHCNLVVLPKRKREKEYLVLNSVPQ